MGAHLEVTCPRSQLKELLDEDFSFRKYHINVDGCLPEAHEEHNRRQRDIIKKMQDIHGQAVLVRIDSSKLERGQRPCMPWDGSLVFTFGADAVVPVVDDELCELILSRFEAIYSPVTDRTIVGEIMNKIHKIGGHLLVWT